MPHCTFSRKVHNFISHFQQKGVQDLVFLDEINQDLVFGRKGVGKKKKI